MIDLKFKEDFLKNGFVTLPEFFTESEYKIILSYVEEWTNKNISNSLDNSSSVFLPVNNFNDYHKFIVENKIDHSKIASAKYRYIEPPNEIVSIIQKELLFEYLISFTGTSDFIRWQDPGFGWLGYRLIRASSNDGYPPSCKNWGAARDVYSIWLPIEGCTELSTIRFLPGSHKKEYKNYLPEDSKFTKGELRLSEQVPENQYIRPNPKPREIIIYHPATIHSEDSIDNINTRLNLEYRFKPNYES